ncbi:MAG TPA: sigma-70 family RNA polymerase sigma factor [Firmicutes bacterium]|nr:sigma-70 family RNA polymerase sigma factor [Bacillota bacterium]
MRKNLILTRLLGATLRRISADPPLDDRQPVKLAKDRETALVHQAKAGDEDAFRLIVERNQSKVYHLLLGMLRDEDQAQELTQETFVKAWKGLSGFRGDSTLWTWLYRIAYYTALDFLRKTKRQTHQVFLEESGGDLTEQQEKEPLEVVIKRDREEDLHKALARLSFAQRVVLILYYFQGLSYREIAEITRRPLGTIRAELHRGKERLRKIIIKKWGLNDADERPRA